MLSHPPILLRTGQLFCLCVTLASQMKFLLNARRSSRTIATAQAERLADAVQSLRWTLVRALVLVCPRNRLAGKQVLVIGGLTYDNEHFANDNPAGPKSGPKRFSLWEIHPITAFFVCPAGDGCDPTQLGQWVTLTAWATAHP